MTTLFYNLAKNTDKQDRLFEDLERSVPKSGPIDDTAIGDLHYLKACIKESLR